MAPRGFLFAALVAFVADATTSGCEGDVCIAGEVFAEVPETNFDNHISLLQKTAELRAIDKAMYQIKDNEKNENWEEGGDHEHRDDLPKSSEDKEAAELRAIDKKKKPVAMYPTKENHKNEEEDEQTDDQEELVNVTRGHKDARAELEEKEIEEELMTELEDEEVEVAKCTAEM